MFMAILAKDLLSGEPGSISTYLLLDMALQYRSCIQLCRCL